MASFLLGQVNNGQISTNELHLVARRSPGRSTRRTTGRSPPKLTLNLGLRYELFSPISEKFGRQSNFVYDNLTLYIPEGQGPGRSAAAELRHGIPAT